MSRKEQIIANRNDANNYFDTVLFETANSEAYLELYKACREGVLSLITESAKSGKHEKDIIWSFGVAAGVLAATLQNCNK